MKKCFGISPTIVLLHWLFAYVVGLLLLLLGCLFLVYGGVFNIHPFRVKDLENEMFNCIEKGVACFTLTYNLTCQALVLRCRYDTALYSVLGLLAAFSMSIALTMLFIYANISVYILLSFCFLGGVFGGLVLFNLKMNSAQEFIGDASNYSFVSYVRGSE